jgi:hypothetical protein
MSERIQIHTLTDGGQQPAEIARLVAAFVDAAERTLELAQYDFHLGEETAAIVGDALRRAAGRGVRIRFADALQSQRIILLLRIYRPAQRNANEALAARPPAEHLPAGDAV